MSLSKARKSSRSSGKPLSRSLRIYQKIALLFVAGALLLLIIVLYLSVSKATIKIDPAEKVVSTNITVEVANPPSTNQLAGIVIEDTFSKGKTFTLSSEGAEAVEQKAGGLVTLINESGEDQQLVATTRLLSEEGILFRLDEGTTVPANGSIDVIAHADQPGLDGEIGPSQFTIPGLNESRQQEVYAVSVEQMVGGLVYIRTLTEADLESAVEELTEEVLEESKAMLAERVDEALDYAEYTTEVTEKVADSEPGAEIGAFTVSLSVVVTGVFFDQEVVADYARAELQTRVAEGYEIAKVNDEGLQIEVQNSNPNQGTASLSVYLDGIAVISTASDILDKERFLGRAPQEVETILESSNAIEEVSISFTPFWLKRVPTLKDHIKIIVKDID